MEKDSLFGSEFLTKVVEWSNLKRHSGKLFCSLKNTCALSVKDAVGYASVGKDVIDYSVSLQMDKETMTTRKSSNSQIKRLKSMIRLPEKPHSRRPGCKQSALVRVSERIRLRRRLLNIQKTESQKGRSSKTRKHEAEDPLGRCMSLQVAAAGDLCKQMRRFPNRLRFSSAVDGKIILDFEGLPLLRETIEALSLVTMGSMPLLKSREGLTLKFKYYSQRQKCFLD